MKIYSASELYTKTIQNRDSFLAKDAFTEKALEMISEAAAQGHMHVEIPNSFENVLNSKHFCNTLFSKGYQAVPGTSKRKECKGASVIYVNWNLPQIAQIRAKADADKDADIEK